MTEHKSWVDNDDDDLNNDDDHNDDANDENDDNDDDDDDDTVVGAECDTGKDENDDVNYYANVTDIVLHREIKYSVYVLKILIEIM